MNTSRRDQFTKKQGPELHNVDNELQMLVDNHNNHDTGLKAWTVVNASGATSVPLVVSNSTGTQNIATLKDGSTTVLTVADGGTTTIAANGGTNKALVANNGTSTGNILEAQDNGTAVFTVADGGTVTHTGVSRGPDGDATSPTYSFASSGNTDNGLYLAGTDNPAITAGGTKRLDVSTSAINVALNLVFDNNATHGVKGTATNDSAPAGNLGEYLSAVGGPSNAPTSTQFGDLVQLSLTAGDWDVTAGLYWTINASTWTVVEIGISSTTGNSTTGLTIGDNRFKAIHGSSATTPAAVSLYVPSFRVSLSGTVIYYMKYSATYSAGTPQAQGRMSARRVR